MYEFVIDRERKIIDRLLAGGPLLRYHTLVDLLRKSPQDQEVRSARQSSRKSRETTALLNDMRPDGTFGNPPGRPDWWGPGIRIKEAPNVHPWVVKMLHDAGYSRGDEGIRLVSEYFLGLQEADGGFGEIKGVERVRFSADLTYVLSLVGYDQSTPIKNAQRWLLARLKEFPPGRFDRGEKSPGRVTLEALAFFEPFLFSPLARKILHTLFESNQSVLKQTVTPEGIRLVGYDGLLTWGELGFRLGWPRSSEIPWQIVSLLMQVRNRDGSWGEKGTDLVSTLRAMVLWRNLFDAYGEVPEGFRGPVEIARPTAQSAAPAETAAAVTSAPSSVSAGPGSGTRDRHLRAFARAGVDAMANDLVEILTSLGFEPDWRPMYEVQFRSSAQASSFRLRLEAKQAGFSGPQLVLLGSSCRQLSLKHWGRQLSLDRQRLRYMGDQLRLMLDNSSRKVMGRIKEFLVQEIIAAGAPTPTSADRTPSPPRRSHRGGRRRSRGGPR